MSDLWNAVARPVVKTASGETIYRGVKVILPEEMRAEINQLARGPMTEEEIDQEFKIGPMLLHWLETNGGNWDPKMKLGRHWTTRYEMAEGAAMQGGAYGGIGIILEATYDEAGVDPAMSYTTPESHESESEVTLLPGAKVTITAVYLHNYGFGYRYNLLKTPIRSTAVVEDFKGTGRNMSKPQVLAACMRILKDMAKQFGYTGPLPEVMMDAYLPGGTIARAIDSSREMPYGCILLDEQFWLRDAADKEQGYDNFRIFAHEAIHALVQKDEASYAGFSQMITEGGAEVLSVAYWAQHAPAYDDRDAYRQPSTPDSSAKWIAGDRALVRRMNYKDWVAEVMLRAGGKNSWDVPRMLAEIQQAIAGNHNVKLDFRNTTDPGSKPPSGVGSDAESLMLWLIGQLTRQQRKASLEPYTEMSPQAFAKWSWDLIPSNGWMKNDGRVIAVLNHEDYERDADWVRVALNFEADLNIESSGPMTEAQSQAVRVIFANAKCTSLALASHRHDKGSWNKDIRTSDVDGLIAAFNASLGSKTANWMDDHAVEIHQPWETDWHELEPGMWFLDRVLGGGWRAVFERDKLTGKKRDEFIEQYGDVPFGWSRFVNIWVTGAPDSGKVLNGTAASLESAKAKAERAGKVNDDASVRERERMHARFPELYAKQGALSLEAVISVAEQTMERSGNAGRTIEVPVAHLPTDPDLVNYNAAIEPLVQWVSGLVGHRIRFYASDYSLNQYGKIQAMTDGYNSIVVRPVTTEATVLHEVAHCINGTQEGKGHDAQFARILHGLYATHIGQEAADVFWGIVGLYVDEPKTAANEATSRLKEVARFFPDFDDFERAFQQGIIGRYWHITSDPNFVVRSTTTDAVMGETMAGFFCTPLPDQWRYYAKGRPYCVEVRLRGRPGLDYGDGDYWEGLSGDGRQIFVPDPVRTVEVVKVTSYDAGAAAGRRYWASLPDTAAGLAKLWLEVYPEAEVPTDHYGTPLVASHRAAKTYRFYHGTTTRALEAIRSSGEIRTVKPSKVAADIEREYHLPSGSVFNEPGFYFSRDREDDPHIYLSGDFDTAHSYAGGGSEVVSDAMSSAWFLLNPSEDPRGRELDDPIAKLREPWVREQMRKFHGDSVVLTLDLPADFVWEHLNDYQHQHFGAMDKMVEVMDQYGPGTATWMLKAPIPASYITATRVL